MIPILVTDAFFCGFMTAVGIKLNSRGQPALAARALLAGIVPLIIWVSVAQ